MPFSYKDGKKVPGLYNRRSSLSLAEPFLEQAKENNEALLTMIFDLDGLKIINDAFGHSEGNFAIRVLGRALEDAKTITDI